MPPGLPRRQFMALLEQRIETATGKLLAKGEREIAIPRTV